VLAIGREVHGFKPCRVLLVSKGDKNSQYDFLRRGSKTVVPRNKFLATCQRTLQVWREILRRQNLRRFLAKLLLLRYKVSSSNHNRALMDVSGMTITQMGDEQ